MSTNCYIGSLRLGSFTEVVSTREGISRRRSEILQSDFSKKTKINVKRYYLQEKDVPTEISLG